MQGKILIHLVDRECEKTSYELIKEYRGGFRVFFWQGFVKLFVADLKSSHEKDDKDKIVERGFYYWWNRGNCSLVSTSKSRPFLTVAHSV